MNSNTGATSRSATTVYLPAMMLLFVGSGCAALIYEVVWFQLLQLVIGSSAVSLGVLLGTFMGGMCLGSYLLPRYIGVATHPLRVYAWLEIVIGACGLLLLFGMPLVNSLYGAIGGGNIFVRGVVAAICLLPPAVMMGATLPAVARYVGTTAQGVSWLGYFYGGNIAGAVLGAVLAGFYLLRVHDMAVATYVAVALNAGVGMLALLLATRAVYTPGTQSVAPAYTPVATATGPVSAAWPGYVAIGLSGATALACQVIWVRLLSLLFGASTYAFSLILAVFLFGLGIGSSLGAALARSTTRPRVVFGWFQLALCLAIAWGAYMLSASLPFWPINPSISWEESAIWYNFQLDLVRCLWVVLPGAMLWGASFPMALAAVARPGQDMGRVVGGVYAANTVGAIIGSLVASLVITRSVGSQVGQQILIGLSAVSGLLLLGPIALGKLEGAAGRFRPALTAALVAVIAVTAVMISKVPPVPGILAAYGRHAATWVGQTKVVYVGEGLNAFVAVTDSPNGVRNYHNAGKVQASSHALDMRLQRMLGHFTHLMPKKPANALVIGCGAGVTAGAVSIGPGVDNVTIAEIEPLVPKSVAEYFGDYNYNVVRNPKVHIHIDDARHFLLNTDQKFDAITSDPLDPWVKGAAALYTSEFFDLVKRKLNPGGVVTLFVQLYGANEASAKSEIGTFMKAFPNSVVWGNPQDGVGYDLVLMGMMDPIRIDVDALQAKLDQPEYAQVKQSLREIGIESAVALLANYAGTPRDLAPWLEDAQLNRDRNLRLQYLAGLGLNLNVAGPIYANMLKYAQLPDDMFSGKPETLQSLRAEFARLAGK